MYEEEGLLCPRLHSMVEVYDVSIRFRFVSVCTADGRLLGARYPRAEGVGGGGLHLSV